MRWLSVERVGYVPFVQGGDSAEPSGQIGSGLPPATLVVQPDKILFVKRGFEDERDRIRSFINDKGHLLVDLRPPGTDPCSDGVVDVLGKNGQSALDAARGYVDELTNIIQSLNDAATDYGLVEQANADKFGQGPA
ncbi:hypothetical protein [Actinophytocola sp.]|uniref:hypothetical protein n=1 Tax=Actinophytocola sp. TaxID=1872138 RepID=UPI002D80D0BD|nr:hypothetical protein [Actinophytocola sp.]HET9143231.1 hypothetical protein [Actinophytocola sp.]